MCNLCYKHMFVIIVVVNYNFHIMCIKDGKEKCISNVVAINLHTQKLIVKERKNE